MIVIFIRKILDRLMYLRNNVSNKIQEHSYNFTTDK